MPSHYLLTTCLLSVCDHLVLLYVILVIHCMSCIVLVVCRTSYVVRGTIIRSHRHTVALTLHSPSHGAVPGANYWEFVGGGIAICKAVKLQRLGCIGLRRVRLVMWLAKRGWHLCPELISPPPITSASTIAIAPALPKSSPSPCKSSLSSTISFFTVSL